MFRILPLLLLLSFAQARAGQTFSWPGGTRAAVCLTYDDGVDVHLDHAVPDLNAVNLRGTFYVPGNSQSLYKRMAEWREIVTRGHEVGNHSVFHPCLRVSTGGQERTWLAPERELEKYTVPQMAAELRAMNTTLLALDGHASRTYAYNCSDSLAGGKSFVDAIRPLFTAARVGEGPELADPRTVDVHFVPSWMVRDVSGEEMIAFVRKAVEKNALAVFMFHGVGGGHNINVDREAHRKLLAWLAAHRAEVWTDTFQNVMRHVADARVPEAKAAAYKDIPREYLEEAANIPPFWVSTVDGVFRYLDEKVQTGKVVTFGTTAGGRPLRGVFYGEPRAGRGTTTFSGSLGFGDVRAYLGPDYARKVYMAMGSVHGGELEGIVGLVNLIAVLETGRDLRGTAWPEISAAARALDRVILVPIANVDGRARVPFRMLRHWGRNTNVAEYFNTGGWKDGSLIGWPVCKQYIPLDFSKTQFPGGYPNDAGINIQHDDFFGQPQPETRALLNLAARERPDLILNLHTGAGFTAVLREFIEPALTPAWEEYYRRVHTALARAGLRRTTDLAREADPSRSVAGVFNLSSALNLHCGALVSLIESPSHCGASGTRDDKMAVHTPDDLVNAQLTCHQEAMKFLVETGGRYRWTAKK